MTGPRAALTLVMVVVAASISAAAGASADDDSARAEEDAMVAAAAGFLADDVGVSDAEAVRRITEQREMFALTARLATELAESWAGARIDQTGGGRLIVATTDTQTASDAIKSLASDEIADKVEVVQVAHALPELDALALKVRESLLPQLSDVSVIVLPGTNTIQIGFSNAAESVVTEQEAATTVQALRPPATVEFEIVERGPIVPAAGCLATVGICDPPLRGGIQMQSSVSLCTAGFLVKSNINSNRFVLTAGHCLQDRETTEPGVVYDTSDWGTWFKDGSHHVIGARHNSLWDFGTDAGIIRVNNPSGWQASPGDTRVLVQTSGGTRPTGRSEWYDIAAIGNNVPGGIPADGYLCSTGTVTDTQCFMYTGNVAGTNLSQASVPTGSGDEGICQGDSGAPVYAYNQGFGLIHGFINPGVVGSHIVYPSFTWVSWCAPQGATIQYTSLWGATQLMNVNIIT